MKEYIINERSLSEIDSAIGVLVNLLSDRVESVDGIMGNINECHAFMFYREKLWEIRQKLSISCQKQDVNNLLDGFDSWLFEKKIKVNLLEFNDGKYDHLWRSPNEQVNYSTRELFSMYLDTKE